MLYDHIQINTKVKDLWLQQATSRRYSVPIKNLTEAEIASWNPSMRTNTWEDIDPYSGLEDVGDSSESEQLCEKVAEPASSTESDNANMKQRLCTRKPVRPNTGRPKRKASSNVNYKDLSQDNTTETTQKAKPHPIALLGPSESHILQHEVDVLNHLVQHILYK